MQHGVLDDIDAAAQAQLSHRIRLVGLDGLDAERQLGADFLIAVAGRDEAKYPRLALAEFSRRFRRLVGWSFER